MPAATPGSRRGASSSWRAATGKGGRRAELHPCHCRLVRPDWHRARAARPGTFASAWQPWEAPRWSFRPGRAPSRPIPRPTVQACPVAPCAAAAGPCLPARGRVRLTAGSHKRRGGGGFLPGQERAEFPDGGHQRGGEHHGDRSGHWDAHRSSSASASQMLSVGCADTLIGMSSGWPTRPPRARTDRGPCKILPRFLRG